MARKSSKRDLHYNLALGKSLKKIWRDTANFESIPLTFGELTGGNKFIAMPIPGDNHGHGGLLGVNYILMKIHPRISFGSPYSAIRVIDGVPIHVSDEEWVYLVQ